MTADCLYLRNIMEPPETAKFEEKGRPLEPWMPSTFASENSLPKTLVML